jgi:predicted neuraminidase
MAHNPSATGRESLRLSASNDGVHWADIAVLAGSSTASSASNVVANQAPAGPDEFSYPALAWADGKLWVSYTDQRQRIAWVSLGPMP